uniref:Uncharacterized protein n=1 Tax=Escherichia coli TaxID=562 RepID=A0A8F1IF20_ECOLX|nr:hypothetical protein IHCLGBEB_00155 [Escherichia coli]
MFIAVVAALILNRLYCSLFLTAKLPNHFAPGILLYKYRGIMKALLMYMLKQ